MGCGSSHSKHGGRSKRDVRAVKSIPDSQEYFRQEMYGVRSSRGQSVASADSPSAERKALNPKEDSPNEKWYLESMKARESKSENFDKGNLGPLRDTLVDAPCESPPEMYKDEIYERRDRKALILKPYEKPPAGEFLTNNRYAEAEAPYTRETLHLPIVDVGSNQNSPRQFYSYQRIVYDGRVPRRATTPIIVEEDPFSVNRPRSSSRLHKRDSGRSVTPNSKRVSQSDSRGISPQRTRSSGRRLNSYSKEGSTSLTPLRRRPPSFDGFLEVTPMARRAQTPQRTVEPSSMSCTPSTPTTNQNKRPQRSEKQNNGTPPQSHLESYRRALDEQRHNGIPLTSQPKVFKGPEAPKKETAPVSTISPMEAVTPNLVISSPMESYEHSSAAHSTQRYRKLSTGAPTGDPVLSNTEITPSQRTPRNVTEIASSTSRSQSAFRDKPLATQEKNARDFARVSAALSSLESISLDGTESSLRKAEVQDLVEELLEVSGASRDRIQRISSGHDSLKWQVAQTPPIDNAAWDILRQVRFFLEMRNETAI